MIGDSPSPPSSNGVTSGQVCLQCIIEGQLCRSCLPRVAYGSSAVALSRSPGALSTGIGLRDVVGRPDPLNALF
jgi:hypothetical protein